MAKRSDFAGMDLLTAFGEKESSKLEIQLSDIVPNPSQPRVFGKEEVSDLVESMKRLGLIEPIVVRKFGKSIRLLQEKDGIRPQKFLNGIRFLPLKPRRPRTNVLRWLSQKMKKEKV